MKAVAVDWVAAAVRQPESEVIVFLGSNRLEVLIACLHLSVATMTTLGYGDITPEQPITKFLAYMEAVAGIFYTTVLVASLIGMQLAGHKASSQESG